MSDRLLFTRQERARDFAVKFLACLTPTALLFVVILALGGQTAALTTGLFGGLAALGLATTVRTRRGAVGTGIVIGVVMVLLLLFFADVRG